MSLEKSRLGPNGTVVDDNSETPPRKGVNSERPERKPPNRERPAQRSGGAGETGPSTDPERPGNLPDDEPVGNPDRHNQPL